MKKLLIDRRGTILPVERGLRRISRYKLPYDSDPLTFAIRNLGVIEVAFAEWGARVRLRPAIASSRAVSELMYLLSDIRPRRFVLTHLQRTWEEELVPAFSPMVLRLEELVYGVRSRHPDKLFHAEDRSLDPDQSLMPAPFARLLRQWIQRNGRLPDNATLPFRRSGCLGRTTLVEEWAGDESMTNHYATAVIRDGVLYGYHGRQEYGPSLRAVDLATGQVRWTEDRFGAGSLILAGGRLVILRESGELMLAEASPERFSPTARAQILPGVVRAYPALADGRLYARNTDTLIAVDLR